jgi:glyoxylase-like metal-dependent hydrolase (beta-lactamase superfamily II)
VSGSGERLSAPGAPIEIRLLRLRWSNAYLLLGERPVVVDAGSPGDEAPILAALAAAGRGPRDLAAIVLTHGHADHAGAAAALRAATGAPVLLGDGDTAMAAAGRNLPLVPTGLEARLVAPFVPQAFPGVVPDVVVAEPLDLSAYGISATLRPLGGHTRGSAIVELPWGDVVVGDLLRGGRLGGRLRAKVPMTHYYEEEPAAVTAVAGRVLDAGARRLLVGHGGPLAADAVAAWRGRRTA